MVSQFKFSICISGSDSVFILATLRANSTPKLIVPQHWSKILPLSPALVDQWLEITMVPISFGNVPCNIGDGGKSDSTLPEPSKITSYYLWEHDIMTVFELTRYFKPPLPDYSMMNEHILPNRFHWVLLWMHLKYLLQVEKVRKM